MKILYAYDFDGTMIPYDSFRLYLWHLLKFRPMSISLLLALRKLRLISAAGLKEKVTRIVGRSDTLQRATKRFAKRLVYDVVMPKYAPNDGVVLIISASPKIYMHYVAEALGCELISSDYIDERYVEMFGEQKAETLKERYPKMEYEWAYACSDSVSDICWMQEFKKHNLIDRR